jgi:anti-sigma factor RsiW
MDHSEAMQMSAAERYVLGDLTVSEVEEFERHFFDCPECSEELRMMSVLQDNARAVFLEQNPTPVQPVEIPKPVVREEKPREEKETVIAPQPGAEFYEFYMDRTWDAEYPSYRAVVTSGGAQQLALPISAPKAGQATSRCFLLRMRRIESGRNLQHHESGLRNARDH